MAWWLWCAVAWAGAPDLSGTWVLDPAASDPVDALLEVSGASWIERKAAAKMSVTQVLAQTADTLVVTVDSSFMDRTDTLRLDGAPVRTQDKKGHPMTITTSWVGDVLVTTVVPDDPTLPAMTTRRSLSGGRATMTQTVVVSVGGQEVSADRVFRRAP
jgi:hypothetical protein